jgi:cell division protein FtsI (penicillin-binding protein 3)
MLETVPGPEGTGKKARVANYRVAGKTGTSRKASAAGYAARYVASFAGFAPASDPRLVCVAVINDPSGDEYYGGAVAAPLFSRVMEGALRLLNVPPDDYAASLVNRQEPSTTGEGGP